MYTKWITFMADLPSHTDRVAAITIGGLIVVGAIFLMRWFADK